MTDEKIITEIFQRVKWSITPARLLDAMKNQSWLFSHSFAKAFWGEILFIDTGWYEKSDILHKDRYIKGWQYHLQQMVLEENPLRYLEKFL